MQATGVMVCISTSKGMDSAPLPLVRCAAREMKELM
jgi:hypothetical protein